MAISHEFLSFGTNIVLLSLIVAFHIVFLAIEILAFKYGRSLSLLSDALHSALDIGTFLINLWAEYKISRAKNIEYVQLPDSNGLANGKEDNLSAADIRRLLQESADWWETVAVVTTAGALFVSTLYVVYESIERLVLCETNEEINEDILLWIVLPMFVINGIIIFAFCALPGLKGFAHSHSHSHAHGHFQGCTHGEKMNSNMFSAFSHVLADQFQNLALLVVALMVRFHIGDPIVVDAVGGILTGILTAMIAFAVLRAKISRANVKEGQRCAEAACKEGNEREVSFRVDASTPLKVHTNHLS
mmetsp:Transcript_34742/g.84058  ORF Transcript_34742/g.84058 Transcript_34742/m.84058 type:complete len:303 (-) Transcript_34742:107-1015(-)